MQAAINSASVPTRITQVLCWSGGLMRSVLCLLQSAERNAKLMSISQSLLESQITLLA